MCIPKGQHYLQLKIISPTKKTPQPRKETLMLWYSWEHLRYFTQKRDKF